MKFEIFLTDKILRTRSTVYTESHWGPSITIHLMDESDYMVKVKHLSNFDPRNPDACKEYTADDYENCVDKKLQDLWKPVLGCNPPWLSPQDRCNGVIHGIYDFIEVFGKPAGTLNSILNMESYPAREKCKRPCTVTQSNFFLGKKKKGFYYGSASIKFKFATEVVHKTRVLGYGFSHFLIDLGSSLGLWFGLSVFGIADLGILSFHWVRNLNIDSFKKLFK